MIETLEPSALGVEMPHSNHEQHLCFLRNVGHLLRNYEDYKKLVGDPKFICKSCGRSAASDQNLCEPDKL